MTLSHSSGYSKEAIYIRNVCIQFQYTVMIQNTTTGTSLPLIPQFTDDMLILSIASFIPFFYTRNNLSTLYAIFFLFLHLSKEHFPH